MTSRKVETLLPYPSVIFVFKWRNKLLNAGNLRHFNDFLQSRIFSRHADIISNGSLHELDILPCYSQLAEPVLTRQLVKVYAVDF